MSFRSWLFVAAIGLTSGTGLSAQVANKPTLDGQPVTESGEEQGTADADQGSEGQSSDPVDISPALQGIEAAIRDLIAEEDKVESERQKQQEIRDLDAQERMAYWAKLMTWATAVSVIVTGIGVIFVRKTLVQANETNKATVAASAAANEANIIARQEQRPWVTMEWKIPCEFSLEPDGVHYVIDWNFTFRNAGKSPAFGTKSDWSVYRLNTKFFRVAQSGIDEVVAEAKGAIMRTSAAPIIFPGEKIDIKASDRRPIRGQNAERIFLCCCITYALDPDGREFALEARAYEIEPTANPSAGHTHDIWHYLGYDRIETWSVQHHKGKL